MTTGHVDTDRGLFPWKQARAELLQLRLDIYELHVVEIDDGQADGARQEVDADEQVDLIRVVVDPEMLLVEALLETGQNLRGGQIGVRAVGQLEDGRVGGSLDKDMVKVFIVADGKEEPSAKVDRDERAIGQKLPGLDVGKLCKRVVS